MEAIATSVIPLLSGPSSAVLVLLMVLGTTYYLFAKKILPLFSELLSKRDADFAVLMSSHTSDREAWLLAIEKIGNGIDELRVSQEHLSADMDNVLNNVRVMRSDIATVLGKSAAGKV
jgi:hypothetical protein